MKTYLILVFSVIFSNFIFAQNQVLFFDDFEETISNDATFTKWTTETLEGWQYWHIIPGQYMRFENNDLDQNDWLITKKINCAGAGNLKVNFSYLYSANKVPPRFYYTNQYNGNASQSNWTELSFSFDGNKDQWHSSEDYIIENPGDTIYFAFQYQVAANAGALFLLDNFSVRNYSLPPPSVKVGSTEHFDFFTHMPDKMDFYSEIENDLETQYNKLSSLWDRPGKENIFSEEGKIKIYYSEKEYIDFNTNKTPGWKNGFHNASKLEIFLSPLKTSAQENYYSNLVNLAINEFSQLAIEKKLERDNSYYFPAYFMEGFGLYEAGFRPRRDSIVKFINETDLNYDFLVDTSGISNTLKKDVIVSSVEGQILIGGSYLAVGPIYSNYFQDRLPNYWKYFYTEPENQRIKLQRATANFNFYGATSDTSHFTEVVSYFENAYSYYFANFNYKPNHKFNVVFVPTEPIGMQLLGYNDYFNGGVGCGGDLVIELSPNYNFDANYFYNDYFGFAGLCAHEFFHIYYNHFMWEIPGGFWAEGTADFSQRHSLNWPVPQHSLWKIDELFGSYKTNHNVTINLEHIYTNPFGELDIYFLGDMFFEYLYQFHGGYEKIIEFFNQQMDYSVFETTYENIDIGYINFLKSLVGIETNNDEFEENKLNFWISNNQLHIQNSSQNTNIGIEIYTVSGQKLFQKEISITNREKQNFSIPNLPSLQFYLVRIKSENETIIKKLINSSY